LCYRGKKIEIYFCPQTGCYLLAILTIHPLNSLDYRDCHRPQMMVEIISLVVFWTQKRPFFMRNFSCIRNGEFKALFGGVARDWYRSMQQQ